jgi:hypothetical protein
MSDLPDNLALRHDAIALHQYPASDLALLAKLIPIQNDHQGPDSVCNSRWLRRWRSGVRHPHRVGQPSA